MYQTFPDRPGSSNSPKKWEALGTKELGLIGKNVLDLGCNEGYFCEMAKNNGASYVVGVDMDAGLIHSARNRNDEIKYENRSWDEYLRIASTGFFDVIFSLSAFHYVQNKDEFLAGVYRLLAPNGVFVLEVGLINGDKEFFRPVQRTTADASDVVWHMTTPALIRLLSPYFSIRLIGNSISQPGDPINRFIYHCVKRRPWAILASGNPGVGKTDLAKRLSNGNDVHHISLDQLLLEIFPERITNSSDLEGISIDVGSDENLAKFAVDCAMQSMPGNPSALIFEGYALSFEIFSGVLRKKLEFNNFKIVDLNFQ